MVKNSVRISNRTLRFSIIKTSWLMVFKEIIIPVNNENPTEHKYEMQSYWLLQEVVRTVTTWL